MKNFTLYPMSSHQTKIGGLIFTPVALVLLLIVKLHGPFMSLSKPDPDQQLNVLFAAVVLGMYMIAFSKEKHDDERVHVIRAKALQGAFMVSMGSLIAMALTSAMNKEATGVDSAAMCAFAAFALGLYLVIFHFGLYFDPAWAYNDDTVIPNISKNKKFFIIYTIAAVILFTLIFLIHKA